MNNKFSWFFRFLPLLLLVTGCTALTPFPQAARSGDTIALALGSLDGVMNKTNTQVHFTPDSPPGSAPIDITNNIRSSFRIYADPTSTVYSKTQTNSNLNFSYLHHEQWQTVLVLDLPTLPVGTGVINITTSLAQPVALEGQAGAYPDMNALDIAFEVLPGTGTSNPFDFATTFGGTLAGSLNQLRPRHQALVRPPVQDSSGNWPTTYGAIELVMNLPMADDSGTVTDDSIRVVAQDISNFTGSRPQMTWSYDGVSLKVIFIDAAGKLKYYEPRFSVIGETADFTATPVISSVAYYDINGNPAIGPLPVDYGVQVFGGRI